MNWYGIKTLEALGLIWDVKLPKLGSSRIKPVAEREPAAQRQEELVSV